MLFIATIALPAFPHLPTFREETHLLDNATSKQQVEDLVHHKKGEQTLKSVLVLINTTREQVNSAIAKNRESWIQSGYYRTQEEYNDELGKKIAEITAEEKAKGAKLLRTSLPTTFILAGALIITATLPLIYQQTHSWRILRPRAVWCINTLTTRFL